MSFIAVHVDGDERLINTHWIEAIVPSENDSCTIYFAFNVVGDITQDFFTVDESYSKVKELILVGGD